MYKITVGHDSEFGLKVNNKLVSALDYFKTNYESKAGRIFPDNMNCEIAINPVDNEKDFHQYTEELLGEVQRQGYELVMLPVIKYPDEAMENPLAYISGCNPDYSAYSMMENQAPDFNTMDSTRSAGAHVHVGIDGLNVDNWARWMDIYVGLPSLKIEVPNKRRQLYGAAGALREKPYGGEYRTLSNVWINNPELRSFIWEGTHKAVEQSFKHDSREVISDWFEIPTAIDTHDLDLADHVINRLNFLGVKHVS